MLFIYFWKRQHRKVSKLTQDYTVKTHNSDQAIESTEVLLGQSVGRRGYKRTGAEDFREKRKKGGGRHGQSGSEAPKLINHAANKILGTRVSGTRLWTFLMTRLELGF